MYEFVWNWSVGELYYELMNYVCVMLNIFDFSVLRVFSWMEFVYLLNVEVMEMFEEVLVRVCGVVVYLVDDEESFLLVEGLFLVVLIE